MKICYFGIYDPDYSRNRIFIKGLKKNGAEVIECASQKKGVSKYFDLIKKHWKIRNNYDCLIVGFPGQQSMILARFLTGRPIIFDALVSLYDSLVYDRKTVKPKSFRALYFWFLDWLSCFLADAVVVDTNTHADYFSKTFHINRNKFHRIFIGSDDEIIKPFDLKEKNKNFTVHFHGFFNPLQGVKYIIRAGKLLETENIFFNIVGRGQGYNEILELAKNLKTTNINFVDSVPYGKLVEHISGADLCLGVFGDTPKAKRVIPNKVFEALAMRKPVVTGFTPGINELLDDRQNVLLCKTGSPEDLAEKILELKNDQILLKKISENGYKLFLEKLRPEILGKELLDLVVLTKNKK